MEGSGIGWLLQEVRLVGAADSGCAVQTTLQTTLMQSVVGRRGDSEHFGVTESCIVCERLESSRSYQSMSCDAMGGERYSTAGALRLKVCLQAPFGLVGGCEVPSWSLVPSFVAIATCYSIGVRKNAAPFLFGSVRVGSESNRDGRYVLRVLIWFLRKCFVVKEKEKLAGVLSCRRLGCFDSILRAGRGPSWLLALGSWHFTATHLMTPERHEHGKSAVRDKAESRIVNSTRFAVK